MEIPSFLFYHSTTQHQSLQQVKMPKLAIVGCGKPQTAKKKLPIKSTSFIFYYCITARLSSQLAIKQN